MCDRYAILLALGVGVTILDGGALRLVNNHRASRGPFSGIVVEHCGGQTAHYGINNLIGILHILYLLSANMLSKANIQPSRFPVQFLLRSLSILKYIR